MRPWLSLFEEQAEAESDNAKSPAPMISSAAS
jgi:hypothetical protein